MLKNILLCILSVIIVTIVSCHHYGILGSAFRIHPVDYSYDSFFFLSMAKISGNGGFPLASVREVQNLGAPYGGDWNAWPGGRDLLWQFGGILVKYFGLPIAANLLLLLAHASACISMYVSLRWINVTSLWCFVFSVCFGLAPYIFWRNWPHITYSFVYSVPLFLAAIQHLFVQGAGFFNRPKNLVILAAISIFSWSIYYQAVYFVLLIFAGIYIYLNQKSFKAFYLSAFFAFLLAAFFVFQNWAVYFDSITNGKNGEAVQRYYADVQIGALKPLELIFPPPYANLPLLSQISKFYTNQCGLMHNGMSGETFAAYLGLPGIIGLMVLLGSTLYCLAKRREFQISGWFWLIFGVFAFSVIGGVNGIIGLGKIYLLRSSNRFSIFILVAVLFFLATILTKYQARMGRFFSAIFGLVFISLAIGEASLRERPLPNDSSHAISLPNDIAFFKSLESRLPPGSMIFNFPPTKFPEGKLHYPELRAFIASTDLRFSYGSMKGRAREAWQEKIASLPADEMVLNLESYGFSGILAYVGADLEIEANSKLKDFTFQKIENLRRLGLIQFTDASGSFVFFKIQPSADPRFPKSPPYFSRGFWTSEVENSDIHLPEDWRGQVRWAAQSQAVVEVFNEEKIERTLWLKGDVIGTKETVLKIQVNSEIIYSGTTSNHPPSGFITKPIKVAAHKSARFLFQSDQKPVFVGGRKFSFGIHDLVINWE